MICLGSGCYIFSSCSRTIHGLKSRFGLKTLYPKPLQDGVPVGGLYGGN